MEVYGTQEWGGQTRLFPHSKVRRIVGKSASMDYRDLTDEQKAKISGKTPEDLFSLAKNEGVELSEKEMEAIAGGRDWKVAECPKCHREEIGHPGELFTCPRCGTKFMP